jgi:hypothetical protein
MKFCFPNKFLFFFFNEEKEEECPLVEAIDGNMEFSQAFRRILTEIFDKYSHSKFFLSVDEFQEYINDIGREAWPDKVIKELFPKFNTNPVRL